VELERGRQHAKNRARGSGMFYAARPRQFLSMCLSRTQRDGRMRAPQGRTIMAYAYRSTTQPSWTLFVVKKDDFSAVPPAELERFGTPVFVKEVPVPPRASLAGGPSSDELRETTTKGYLFHQAKTKHAEH
jgi:uncharacterized protein